MVKELSEETGTALDPLSGLFKLLSDGTRLRILMLLSKGERNVTSLCDELGLPQPTVSHHLGLLRMRQVIVNRRSGKQVFYGLDGQVKVDGPGSLRIRSNGFTIDITPPAGEQM
jgi:DNA-binding transcriptional ArsR family regulator